MPLPPSFAPARRPTVDEWGVYDPQQAGLAALYTKLTDTPRPDVPEPNSEMARARVLGDAAPGRGRTLS